MVDQVVPTKKLWNVAGAAKARRQGAFHGQLPSELASKKLSEMNEFKATVKEVTSLINADISEALGRLKYVSVTFAIEGAAHDLGTVVRAEFKEPEKFSGGNELERADNAPVQGYLVRDGVFTASLLENPQLVEGASFPVKISTLSDSKEAL